MEYKKCFVSNKNFICRKTFPKTDEYFYNKPRYRKDGTAWTQWDGRCKECQKEFARSKKPLTTGNIIKEKDPVKQEAARERERQKHKPLDHCGPRGVERLFCCDLKATSGYWTC